MGVAQTALRQISRSPAASLRRPTTSMASTRPPSILSRRDARCADPDRRLAEHDGRRQLRVCRPGHRNPPVPDADNIPDEPPAILHADQCSRANLGVAGRRRGVPQATQGSPNAAGAPSPFSAYLSQPTIAPALPTFRWARSTASPSACRPANRLIPQPRRRFLTTTGSYMRDMLRALATIGSLTSTQANVPGFQDLVQDTRTSLIGAISAHGDRMPVCWATCSRRSRPRRRSLATRRRR